MRRQLRRRRDGGRSRTGIHQTLRDRLDTEVESLELPGSEEHQVAGLAEDDIVRCPGARNVNERWPGPALQHRAVRLAKPPDPVAARSRATRERWRETMTAQRRYRRGRPAAARCSPTSAPMARREVHAPTGALGGRSRVTTANMWRPGTGGRSGDLLRLRVTPHRRPVHRSHRPVEIERCVWRCRETTFIMVRGAQAVTRAGGTCVDRHSRLER